jgi:hypothetical protein
MSEETKTRTPQQNKCLHGWLNSVAEALNDAGLDMKKTLKPAVEIPWTGPSAKEFLWRPIQEVLANVESTTDASTKEYILISEVITRHLGDKHGVSIPPWPTQQNRGGKDNGYE